MRRIILLSAILALALGGNVPAPARAQQTSASVQLAPCKYDVGLGASKSQIDAQCTTIRVPEDRSKADGRQVTLAVTVLAATGSTKKAEPIFHLEGGPGGSAIENFGQSWIGAYRDLRQEHDIVLIDQRGTGKSTSLQCTEFTSEAFNDIKDAKRDEDTDVDTAVERMQACLKRLSASTDPAFYTSTVFADDTDAVRTALGYDKINVFGNSYGTWLAQIYLGRYGQHVNAMVLDSVAGPWNFYLLKSAESAQTALDNIFAMCKADSACAKTYPDLEGKLQTVLDKLEKEPAKANGIGTLTGKTYPVALTRGRFLEALRAMMYNSGNISIIPQAIIAASKGDYTLIAAQTVLRAETASQISLGMYYSVQCSESLPFITDDIVKQSNLDVFYGTSKRVVPQLKSICGAWRSAELNPADVAPVKSDRPVLVLVGALDPITPTAFGNETNQRLTNSTLAVFPYQAHGPLVGSRCAQRLVQTFFAAPTKTLDTSCTKSDVKPVFAGAYRVDISQYVDQARGFQTNMPKGWTYLEDKSTEQMAFFASPDGTQLLGMGILKGMKGAAAQKAAFAMIEKAFGPVDIQLSQSQLFITIVQHGLNTSDQTYIGAMMVNSLTPDAKIVWLAAPPNILQATLMPVLLPVTSSLNPLK